MKPTALTLNGRPARQPGPFAEVEHGARLTVNRRGGLLFLAELSHELRTSLLTVAGYTEMLLGGAPQEFSVDEVLSAIHSNTRYLIDLLDSMIELPARQGADSSDTAVVCGPEEILQDVLKNFRVQAEAKGLRLQCRIGAALPADIVVDKMGLHRILVNLVSNAIKYSHSGTITIIAEVDESSRDMQDDSLCLVFKVQDEGVGIDPQELSSLDRAFFRGTTGMTTVADGNGLGLFITRQLVEALNGELSVVSAVGQGSTFSVRLPVGLPPNRAERGATFSAEPAADHEPLCGGRILVVENDPDLQCMLEACLCGLGAQVVIAGDDCQCMTRVQQQSFDLIVLDLQLPKLHGEATAQKLRAHGFKGAIIAFSGARPLSKEAMARAGFNAFVRKTNTLQPLLTACREHLPRPIRVADGAGPLPSPGNPRFVELQVKYAERLNALMDELRTALHEGDRDVMARVTHRLMGTSGLFGVNGVGDAARTINDALAEGHLPVILEHLFRELESPVDEFVRSLKATNKPR